MHYAKYVWPEAANAALGVDDVEGFPEPWLLAHVPPMGGVALDVGANVGAWSRLLARRFDRVYAMEPNPTLHGELRSIARVEVVPYGAFWRSMDLEYVTYADSAHLSSHFVQRGINTGERTGSVRLPVCRIDTLGFDGAVDFVKVDVEGEEVKALCGANGMIEHDRPKMVIEVHSTVARRGIEWLLRDWDYRTEEVRHPYYATRSEFWECHYWLIAKPSEME